MSLHKRLHTMHENSNAPSVYTMNMQEISLLFMNLVYNCISIHPIAYTVCIHMQPNLCPKRIYKT